MQQRVTLYLKLNIFFEDGLKGSSDKAPVAAVRLKNLHSYETRSNNCQFFISFFFPFFFVLRDPNLFKDMSQGLRRLLRQ